MRDDRGGRSVGRVLARVTRRLVLAVGVLAVLLAAGAVSAEKWLSSPSGAGANSGAPIGGSVPTRPATAAPTSAAASHPTAPATTPAPTPTTPAAGGAGLTAADRAAGLLTAAVPDRGTGRLGVVPGTAGAPGKGTVKRVRVEVEGGLDVDGAVFARFVMNTLNDARSWSHGGRLTFARTAGSADLRVVLASPRTSQALCAPLRTMGTLSCGIGGTAVLTLYRWVRAIPDYGSDRTGYRHYLVNHEVGHTLGHGHQLCPGTGKAAPVMMQQTKGLKGCLPNPWPYP